MPLVIVSSERSSLVSRPAEVSGVYFWRMWLVCMSVVVRSPQHDYVVYGW